MLAMRQLEQGRLATAHTNFILCRDIDHMALTINELSKTSNLNSEGDLFVARAMLELMSRTENFVLPLRLRKEYFASLSSPLLNFVDMLPDVIELKDFMLYKDLIAKYDQQIKRDPNLMNVIIIACLFFIKYLERIAQKYFGQRLREEGGLAKLLNSFLGGGQA